MTRTIKLSSLPKQVQLQVIAAQHKESVGDKQIYTTISYQPNTSDYSDDTVEYKLHIELLIQGDLLPKQTDQSAVAAYAIKNVSKFLPSKIDIRREVGTDPVGKEIIPLIREHITNGGNWKFSAKSRAWISDITEYREVENDPQ